MKKEINTKEENMLKEALVNVTSLNFTKSLLSQSYQNYFKGHENEVIKMLNEGLSLLHETAKRNSRKLPEISKYISSKIFKIKNTSFWFGQMYKEYKLKVRPLEDFSVINQFINPNDSLLCYGSGGGYLALFLSKKGYRVSTTDVLNHRTDEAKRLPFELIKSNNELPFADNSFSATIVKAVLHHIEADKLPKVMRELHRVSRRLIVEEDIYNISKASPELPLLIPSQPELKKFILLSKEEQFQVLLLIDYFSNVSIQGIINMNLPFQYKSIETWEKVFDKFGFKTKKTQLVGFRKNIVHKTCHAWLVAEKCHL